MAKKLKIIRFRKNYILTGSLAYMAVFLFTGIKKLLDLSYISYVIQNYPIYKYLFESFFSPNVLAIIVSVLELTVVIAFYFFRLKIALMWVIGLLIFYYLNIISLIIENTFFDCGCGFFYWSSNPSSMLITDLVFIGLAISMLHIIDKNDQDTFNSIRLQ